MHSDPAIYIIFSGAISFGLGGLAVWLTERRRRSSIEKEAWRAARIYYTRQPNP